MAIESVPKYVCMKGEIVPWEEARVHVASAAFKFGAGVFEGIRGYWNDAHGQLYLWQLREHVTRLAASQRAMRYDEVIAPDRIASDVIALVRKNEIRSSVHIVPTVYVEGFQEPGSTGPIGYSITAIPRSAPRWAQGGCTAQVSSWMRLPDNAMPVRIKCNANYQNGALALIQARTDGYDTPILLNSRGKVAEGHAMCFFMIRNGRAVTSPVTADILESITRRTVLRLLPDYCDVAVEVRDIDRSELYYAEEAFFCGTAWEVTPINSIDRVALGDGAPGAITRRLQGIYYQLARGEVDDHSEWRTPVYT